MLSDDDKAAYLAICHQRRRIRRHLARVDRILKRNAERKEANVQAIESIRSDTAEFLKDKVVPLENYVFQLGMLHDTLDLYNANTFLETKAQPMLTHYRNIQTQVETSFKAAKQALRMALKGKGKVLQFERQRS
jgi:2-phospho-L-lactate transferase/gluconeogenesis factor (CofD/UPF0052 family)